MRKKTANRLNNNLTEDGEECQPVILEACNTGNAPEASDSFAQKLSDLLGVPVLAPRTLSIQSVSKNPKAIDNAYVWYDPELGPNGVYDSATGQPESPKNRNRPGYYKWFKPKTKNSKCQ